MKPATVSRIARFRFWHGVLIWLLVLAQPVYAASGAALRLLGPSHWHEPAAKIAVAAPDEAWWQPAVAMAGRLAQQVQDLRELAHARAHADGWVSPHHHHEHRGLLRHWHDPSDSSVHTLGSTADDPALADLIASAACGSATLSLAMPASALPALPAVARGAWPMAVTVAWDDAEMHPASPPPRR